MQNRIKRQILTLARAFALSLAAGAAASALAQGFPTGPVRIIVPFATGSSPDVVSRIYAQKLGAQIGGSVIVETKVGAGTTLGAAYVAQAKPDGQTLFAGSNSAFTIAPHIYPKISYDPEKDFKLIGPLYTTSSVLMVGRDVPIASFPALIQAARSKPGTIAYGSYGIGTAPHLMMEMLISKDRLELIHVPYKGGVEVGQALISGQLPVGFETVPSAAPRAKAGLVKPLVVFAEKRSALMPDVPSTAELGYSDVNILGVVGLFAPAGIPADVQRKLEEAHAAIMKDPDYAERLRAIGAERLDMTAEQMSRSLRDESQRVKLVVQRAKITVQ